MEWGSGGESLLPQHSSKTGAWRGCLLGRAEVACWPCRTLSLTCTLSHHLPWPAAEGQLLMPRSIKIPVVVLGPDRSCSVGFALRQPSCATDGADVGDDEEQHHRCGVECEGWFRKGGCVSERGCCARAGVGDRVRCEPDQCVPASGAFACFLCAGPPDSSVTTPFWILLQCDHCHGRGSGRAALAHQPCSERAAHAAPSQRRCLSGRRARRLHGPSGGAHAAARSRALAHRCWPLPTVTATQL